jgi:glutathione S-transferase
LHPIRARRKADFAGMPPRDGHPQGPTVETPVLWHLEISHYNEKARWALDYKGVAHVRRAVTPGLQGLRARRLRAGRTVPVLEMDGRAIGDSTKIIEEIERRWPEPPLYPADPEERSRALDLEDYFDEQCGHDARRVLFNDTLAEPETFLAMFYGADRRRIGPLETLTPLFSRLVKWRFQIRPETVEESREKVLAAFDKVEADVGPSGYLVGESFTVADLTAASILGLIVVPPEFPYIKVHPDERTAEFRRFRDSLKDRPGFRWVEDMYARHRGTSAEHDARHFERDVRGERRAGPPTLR